MRTDNVPRRKCQMGIVLFGLLVIISPMSGCRKSNEFPPAAQNKNVDKQKTQREIILPPKHGCYIGVFPGWGEFEDSVSAKQLENFEELSGKSATISPFSVFWGENHVSRKQLDEIASYGAIPLLRLMPWGQKGSGLYS